MDTRHGRVAGRVNAARGPPGARIEKTPIAINSPQRWGVRVGRDGGMRLYITHENADIWGGLSPQLLHTNA